MPYRRHIRRHKKTLHLRVVGGALILTAALCVIVPLELHRFAQRNEANSIAHKKTDWDRWTASLPAIAGQSANSRSTGGRTVYPYSVVPGGVRDSRGLREAVSRDPVVAAHYSDFKLARARVVRLGAARTAYVSYRLGNKVYWTRNRVKLARGEELISDGEHFARARCGNRIAESPAGEISPAEPIAEVLERPVDPPGTPDVIKPGFSQSETEEVYEPGSMIPNLPLPRGFPIGESPVHLPPSPGPGGNPSDPPPSLPPIVIPPGPPAIPPSTPVTPQSPVPEPGTFLLITSGLIAVFALRRKIKK